MKPLHLLSDARRPIEAPLPIITVGIDSGMFRGADHLAIQGAIDYAARLGGGIVRILPGRYTLRNAVFLSSHITLEGTPGETILAKAPPRPSSLLTADLDWYGWHAQLSDASNWQVGDGVLITSIEIDAGTRSQFSRHSVANIEASSLGLDSMPRINHWLGKNAQAVAAHSLIEAQQSSGIIVRDLILSADQEADPYLDGYVGGAIFLHDCEDVMLQRVTINSFNGDAISWQVSHDVRVEGCTICGVKDLGLHPGSGSQRPVMRDNSVSDCEDGIYWCWGVRGGVAENNRVMRCRRHGISTGHRDTDNIIRNNQISECGGAGVYFRTERSPGHTSHRVLVEGNEITWASASTAVGIALAPGVRNVRIINNRIRTPAGMAMRGLINIDSADQPIIDGNTIIEQS